LRAFNCFSFSNWASIFFSRVSVAFVMSQISGHRKPLKHKAL
jgi:hypothetical protein